MTHTRPLSPHLTIYQPQLTSVLSILHRMTGVVLYGGAVLWGFFILGNNPGQCYHCSASIYDFFCTWFGGLVFFGWVFCVFYHFWNGLRHLMWDAGRGYDLKTVYRTGYGVVLLTILSMGLTLWRIFGW